MANANTARKLQRVPNDRDRKTPSYRRASNWLLRAVYPKLRTKTVIASDSLKEEYGLHVTGAIVVEAGSVSAEFARYYVSESDLIK